MSPAEGYDFASSDSLRRVLLARLSPPTLENPDTWTVMEDPEGNVFCVSSTATVTGWAEAVVVDLIPDGPIVSRCPGCARGGCRMRMCGWPPTGVWSTPSVSARDRPRMNR